MIRARMGRKIAVTFFCACAVLLSGCGGLGAKSDTSSGAAGSGGPGMAVFDDSHPKVVEAKARCEKEIEESETNPQEKLSSIQVHACMFACRPELTKCVKGSKTEVILKVIIKSEGNVVSAFPIGDTADTPGAKCAAEVISTASFPRFTGADQQVIKYPFTLE